MRPASDDIIQMANRQLTQNGIRIDEDVAVFGVELLDKKFGEVDVLDLVITDRHVTGSEEKKQNDQC